MTWPPPRPDPARVPHRPWDPGLPGDPDLAAEHERLLYVVVDEIVEGRAGLSVARWPHADERGRLRFVDPAGAVEVGTSLDALRRFLRAADAIGAGVRVGTTFGVRAEGASAAALIDELRGRSEHDEARVDDLASVFGRPIDLTRQGRLLAKLATYGAVLPSLPSSLEQRWNMQTEEDR
ncbi:MAG: hypothetical protein ACRDKZ_02465 [Actinomycetota bacterium]